MPKESFDKVSTEKLLTFGDVKKLMVDYFARKVGELRDLPGNRNDEIIGSYERHGTGGYFDRCEFCIYTAQLPEIERLQLPPNRNVRIIFTDHINQPGDEKANFYPDLLVEVGEESVSFKSISSVDGVTALVDQKLGDMISGLNKHADYLDECVKAFSDRASNMRLCSRANSNDTKPKLGIDNKSPSR